MPPQTTQQDVAEHITDNEENPLLPQKKEKSNTFTHIFAFLCFLSVAHYVFSIVYTYLYYPPIWKNVIEGYMEDFGWLPPNPDRHKVHHRSSGSF
eukprot:TRINITY_DN10005_c0_g1_i1.p1 TRINITY_DN10005_c0_g1~~TRINITY_DN10005_c0_g1_i1.p1  ORF type:complete len:110 (+),score=17.80 TRINITY_DN10005_c0_g1_i1:47-331(+)